MSLFKRKKKAVDPTMKAVVSGTRIPLDQVPDEVFSQKMLGDGLAIKPTEEVVVAPAAGEVTVLMEGSGHACGMKLDNGMEILIHIGVDTVEMKGQGFKELVTVGDQVVAGTPLIQFSKADIAAAGHPDMVVFVVAG